MLLDNLIVFRLGLFPVPVKTVVYVKPMFLSRVTKVGILLKRAVLQFRIRLVIFHYTKGKLYFCKFPGTSDKPFKKTNN